MTGKEARGALGASHEVNTLLTTSDRGEALDRVRPPRGFRTSRGGRPVTCVAAVVLFMLWATVLGACYLIWGTEIALCTLTLMILAQVAINELTPHSDHGLCPHGSSKS